MLRLVGRPAGRSVHSKEAGREDSAPTSLIIATPTPSRQRKPKERSSLAEVATVIRWRYAIGTFQVHIPVMTADKILPAEETALAIMKWRLEQTPSTDRWYPVLVRYIGYLSARVDGLGGNAATIPASLTWIPPSLQALCEEQELTGKVCEVQFDCHGDFDGFVLDDCCKSHVFHSRARRVGELALKACREELLVGVFADRRHSGRIIRISVGR